MDDIPTRESNLSQLLANGAFRRLWLANQLSLLGSQISRIGLILYVFNRGDSVVGLALLVALETLPGACIASFAGAIIDRYDKRTVMVLADVARMFLVLIICWRPAFGVIYAAMALHSIATAFFQPAKIAVLPELVEQKDLGRANGLDQGATNLMLIAGPIIGAQLIHYFDLTVTLVIDACTFLASGILIMRVSMPPAPATAPSPSSTMISEIKEGWSYLAKHRLARYLNLMLFMDLICTGLWLPLAPFFVRDHLGGSEQVLGWQFGAFGLGAAAGGLWAPRAMDRFGKGATLIAGLVGEGLSLSLYAMTSHLAASLAILFIWGVAVSMVVVPFYSILQAIVEEKFLGRMFSVVKLSEDLALVFAMAAAMLIHDRVTSRLILLSAGLIYLGVATASTLSWSGRKLFMTR